jgi:hypothetical protein
MTDLQDVNPLVAMADQQDVNPLVAMLVKNPEDPPDLIVLNGYIGPSPDDNSIRLWTSADMSLFVDIPTDLIKGRSTIGPDSRRPFVEDIIWIGREDALLLSETPVVPPLNPPPPGGGVKGPHKLYRRKKKKK